MFKKIQRLLAAAALASMVLTPAADAMVVGSDLTRSESVQSLSHTTVQKNYGKTSLQFEENKGQTDSEARFIVRAPGYQTYLTESGAVFRLQRPAEESTVVDDGRLTGKKKATPTRSERLEMSFVNANPHPEIFGNRQTNTRTNYYFDKKRFENIPNFREVTYTALYEGIDVVFYANAEDHLEYDFVVAPNADPSQIKLGFDGVESLVIDKIGNLIVKTKYSELVHQKPIAFQDIDGERHRVAAAYKLTGTEVSIELGEYDLSRALTIDPVLDYLTYVGGTAFDNTFDIAADANGNAIITGTTGSLNFHGETRDDNDANAAYVAKINADGTAFDYVTILEGNGDDEGKGVAVDASGNAYVTGIASRFFPTTSGAFDTNHGVLNGADAFATKLNSTGTIVYSSFLGGTDFDNGADVAVDTSGKAYVVGTTFSSSFFPKKNEYQGCGFPSVNFNSADAFLTVFNAAGSDITYSSCIGNTAGVAGDTSADDAIGVALDSSNNVYVVGSTKSSTFKTKNAAQPNIGGGRDAFVAKFITTQSGDASVAYATFLGGSGTEDGLGIAVDSGGQAHVTGVTGSTNFPLLNAFDSTNVINEAFVTRYNSTGGLNFSSFLGGANQDEGDNITVDNRGSVYVCGSTLSDDFPLALPFQNVRNGLRDAFVTKIRIGTGIISSTYLGGNGNDKAFSIAVRGNHMFVTGPTESNNLLTTAGVIKATSNASSSNSDGFVAKILDTRLDSVGVFRPNTTFQLTQSINNVVSQNATFTAGLSGTRGVSGDFNGDGIDTIGSFTDGVWKTRNANFPALNLPISIVTTNFGLAGDLPLVGDWNGDGIDTFGTFRPSTGQFFLTNEVNAANVNLVQQFGLAGDLPISGDWNGDGIDTIGVFRPSKGQFFLTDSSDPDPGFNFVAFFGTNGDLPLSGDFDGNGVDSIGVWRPSTAEFFITNNNINIAGQFVFGTVNNGQPIVGDWDGRPLP